MKMLAVTLTLAAGAIAPAAAQSSLQFGVAGGVTINSLAGDGNPRAESRTTPFMGIQVVWQPASAIGFETGAVYVSKGAAGPSFSITRGVGFAGPDLELSVTYVEMPAMLRFALPLQSYGVRPILTAGGSFAFRTGCQLGSSLGDTSSEIDCDDLLFPLDLKSVDIGLSAGAAVDIPAGNRLVIVPGVRYTRGLTDIGDTPDNADAKNSSIELKIALKMRF